MYLVYIVYLVYLRNQTFKMDNNNSQPNSQSSNQSSNPKEEGGYTMVIVYSILIVLLIIVLIWSSMGGESFLPKQTRSDPQKDWDIISELARLNQVQESLLRKVVASRNRVSNVI